MNVKIPEHKINVDEILKQVDSSYIVKFYGIGDLTGQMDIEDIVAGCEDEFLKVIGKEYIREFLNE